MNNKVIKIMKILTICFLVSDYFLKMVFPEQFALFIQNEKFIMIGSFIDNHLWLRYICAAITSFITYWLFLCASSGRWYLNKKECLYIIITIVVIRCVSFFDNTLATALQLSSFLILPSTCQCDFKLSAKIYTFHCISQALSLGIRNLQIYLTNANYVTVFFVGIECYFWLLLWYFDNKKTNVSNLDTQSSID